MARAVSRGGWESGAGATGAMRTVLGNTEVQDGARLIILDPGEKDVNVFFDGFTEVNGTLLVQPPATGSLLRGHSDVVSIGNAASAITLGYQVAGRATATGDLTLAFSVGRADKQ